MEIRMRREEFQYRRFWKVGETERENDVHMDWKKDKRRHTEREAKEVEMEELRRRRERMGRRRGTNGV